MKTMLALRVTLLLGLAAAPAAAQAETCADAVDRFARENQLRIAMPERPSAEATMPPVVPATQESRGVIGMDRLAESGGVIKPPPTGDAAVIEPPKTSESMPTTPPVEPAPPKSEAEPQTKAEPRAGIDRPTPPREREAAARTQAEALLHGAKSAAEEGKEEQCFERLQQAQKLLPDRTG